MKPVVRKLKTLWKDFLTGGVHDEASGFLFMKIVFINTFLLVALIGLAVFGMVHLSAGTYTIGLFELLCSLIALGNIIFFRRSGNHELSCAFLLVLILVVLGFLLISGGLQGTGIYWFYIYPVVAFFLTGKRRGAQWIAAAFFLALVIAVAGTFGYITSLPYSFVEIRQMLVSLFVVSLLVFFYEAAKENNEALISEQHVAVLKKNVALLEKIAEQERTDKALRESEERFHKVADHNIDAILVVDRRNIVRFINPAARKLFGIETETLLGKRFGIPVVEGEATEFEIPKRDGSAAIVEIRTVQIEWENDIAYLESLHDITEHKRAQEALRKSETQLNSSYQREQKRRRFSDTLREVARVVSSSLDQQSVINIILAQLEGVVSYDRVTVMLLDEPGILHVVAGRDTNGSDDVETDFQIEKYPLNAMILQSKLPLLVPDVSREVRWQPTAATQGIQSFIIAPLLVQETPIGILTVGRRDTTRYIEDDSQTVFAFATQVAIAIHNARLHARTQERNRRLALLHKISLAVNSTLELHSLLTSACRELVENFHADHSGVILFDNSANSGEVMAEYPAQGALGKQIPCEGNALAQQLLQTALPAAVYDVQQDPLTEKIWDIMRALSIRSALFVPLIGQGQVIGFFSLDIMSARRPFSQSEIELTQTIASQLATAINNARLLDNERTRLERELETARQIQMSLFPAQDPCIDGLEICGVSFPAREVGGDFYNYFVFEQQHFGVAVGDVSGKGLQAALMMTLSFGLLSTEARREVLPAILLEHLNDELRPHTERNRTNTALCYLCLSPARVGEAPTEAPWDFRVANAGLIAPLIRRRDGTVEWLEANGLPLGMLPGIQYSEMSGQLALSEFLLLCSDGLVEAKNEAGELYGFERLTKCVESASARDAQALQKYILADMRNFAVDTEAHDDMTLVVVMCPAMTGEEN
ncbi:MAG: SpoIIE family protein phosphatase [bacterium]|nr:SpoIIE family protein phosphatase [bacterium]